MATLTTTNVMIAQLATLSSPATLKRLTKVLMQEALEQVDDGFANSRDPYGRSWAKLKSRRGQPLRLTGRLQRSFTRNSESDVSGFKIGSNVKYAAVHQFGHTFPAGSRQVTKKGRFKSKKAASRSKRFSRIKLIGARVVPARPMLPSGNLSTSWTRAMQKAAQVFADKLVKP